MVFNTLIFSEDERIYLGGALSHGFGQFFDRPGSVWHAEMRFRILLKK